MTAPDEARLREKLARIETLFARAATEGERTAAGGARERIRARLRALEREAAPEEFRFSLSDPWARRIFLALLRRYDLRPYRYPGQRHATVMVKAPRPFIDDTLWPEFRELNATLRKYLDEVTERIVAEVLHCDVSEARVEENVRRSGPP